VVTHIVEEYLKTLVVLEWKEIVENWNRWKDLVIPSAKFGSFGGNVMF